jgi:hypothetical protein
VLEIDTLVKAFPGKKIFDNILSRHEGIGHFEEDEVIDERQPALVAYRLNT